MVEQQICRFEVFLLSNTCFTHDTYTKGVHYKEYYVMFNYTSSWVNVVSTTLISLLTLLCVKILCR